MGTRQRQRLLRRRQAAQANNHRRAKAVAVTGTLVGVAAAMIAPPAANAARAESVTANPVGETVPGREDAYISNMTPSGSALYFTAAPRNESGTQLWRTTGGVPTQVTTKLGNQLERVTNVTPVGSSVFFTARDAAGVDQLYKTGGSTASTTKITSFSYNDSASVDDLTAVGGTLFFTAYDDAHGRELWKSNGTAAGTQLVADIEAGDYGSSPTELTALGNKLVFSAGERYEYEYDGYSYHGYRRDLWISDGTAAGTLALTSSHVEPRSMVVNGSSVFFRGEQDESTTLWKSNGTAAGTQSVVALSPSQIVKFGSGVAFTAYASQGRQIFSTDGTAVGTKQLTNLQNFYSYAMVESGGSLFFEHSDGKSRQLWSTGATPGTLKQLTKFSQDAPGVDEYAIAAVGDRVFFGARDGIHGRELWSVKGTGAPTMVRDIRPGGYSSDPGYFVAVGSSLYFTADTPSTGRELWRTVVVPADNTLVGPVVKASSKQKQGKSVKVQVNAAAGEAVTSVASGKVTIGRSSFALKGATVKTAAGRSGTLSLTLSGASGKKVLKGVKAWRKAKGAKKAKLAVKAVVSVRMTDGAANSVTKNVTVNLV